MWTAILAIGPGAAYPAHRAMTNRVPPHNLDAERAVLAALLAEPDRVPEAMEKLSAEDWFDQRHSAVYEALCALSMRGVAIDLVALAEQLAAAGKQAQVGGMAFLAELSSLVSSAAHLRHNAKIVQETALLRRLIRESGEIIAKAYETRPDGEAVRELVSESESRMFKVGAGGTASAVVSVGSAVVEAFKRIDSSTHRTGLTGLPSGFYDLDELLCGFNAGEMIVVAARPSMGKTAFILNCMDHAADPDHAPDWLGRQASVLFFSLEMGNQSIVRRMLCARARVDAHKLRTGRVAGEDYSELTRAAGELGRMKLFIDDTPGITVSTMRSRSKRVKSEHGLDMIVVDYLQLMTHPKAESRQQEISQISRSLKELARELEVPVIALSQLSRAVESRDNKRPQLADLRESGSIEQDADVVLLLYRDEYYNRDNPENKGLAEVICAKQRNGPTGDVVLNFNGSLMRFENRAISVAEPFGA
jgi:replicative DNA helicase